FSRGEDAPPGVTLRDRGDPLVVRLDAPGLRLGRVQVAFQEAVAQIEQGQAGAAGFPVDQDDLGPATTVQTNSATAHTTGAHTTGATSAATASHDCVSRPRVTVHHGPGKDPGLLADSIDGLPERLEERPPLRGQERLNRVEPTQRR